MMVIPDERHRVLAAARAAIHTDQWRRVQIVMALVSRMRRSAKRAHALIRSARARSGAPLIRDPGSVSLDLNRRRDDGRRARSRGAEPWDARKFLRKDVPDYFVCPSK